MTTDEGGRFYCNREKNESHWVLPAEVEVLLDPELQKTLGLYRVLAAAAVRAEVALDSDSVGVLGVGDIIEVIESQWLDSGITRVRFEHGWTSLVARNGTKLLEKEPTAAEAAVAAAAAAAEAAAAKEVVPAAFGEEKPEEKLSNIAAFKEMLEDLGVPAFGSWEKELPKFVGDKRYKRLTTMAERRGAFDSFVRTQPITTTT